MVLVHLTIMVKFDISHVLDMYLPVHETARSSHWVEVPTVTLKARTAGRKEAINAPEQRRGDFRMFLIPETRG